MRRVEARVQAIAQRKANEMERVAYAKYRHLFDEATAFLRPRRVLLYGGTALNYLLPEEARFYEAESLPDVDVMCLDGKRLASEVVQHFEARGHAHAGLSEALHPGTYKVYVDGLQLLDITTVSRRTYAKLAKGAVRTQLGLLAANPEYLRATMHNMLAQPQDSGRWAKMVRRVAAFYARFPVATAPCMAALRAAALEVRLPAAVLQQARRELQRRGCVWTGAAAFERIARQAGLEAVREGPWRLPGAPALECLSEEAPAVVARELVASLAAVDAGAVYAVGELLFDEFAPPHVLVARNGVPFAAVFQPDACLSVVKVGDARVSSLQTTIRLAMALQFSSLRWAARAAGAYGCMADLLVNVMLQQLTRPPGGPKPRALLNSFVTACYGRQPGLVTLRRERRARIAMKEK